MTATTTVTLPDPDKPANEDAIGRDIEALGAALGDARVRAEGGDLVDLAGLDDRVAALCDAVGRLDGAAARALLPRLVALTEGLDALGTTLKRAHEQAARRPAAPPRRLAGAYGGAPR